VSVTLDRDQRPAQHLQLAAPGDRMEPRTLQYYKKHYPKDLTVGTFGVERAVAITQWNGEKAALVHEGYKDRLRTRHRALGVGLHHRHHPHEVPSG